MKRFLIFILSAIILITFISCNNSDKIPDGYEVHYGYIDAVTDTYVLAYFGELGDDMPSKIVRIDIPADQRDWSYVTIRVVAKPEDFCEEFGTCYINDFTINYGKVLKSYYSIRKSDGSKGEPEFG